MFDWLKLKPKKEIYKFIIHFNKNIEKSEIERIIKKDLLPLLDKFSEEDKNLLRYKVNTTNEDIIFYFSNEATKLEFMNHPLVISITTQSKLTPKEHKQDTASAYIPISAEAKIMVESSLEILESSIDLPEENMIEVSKDIEGKLKGNQPNELPSRIFVESIIDSNGKEFPNPIQLSFQKAESMIIYIARNTIDESKIFESEIEAPGFRAEKVVGVGKKDKKKQDEIFIYDSLHKLYSMYDNYMNKNNIIFRDTVYIIKIKNPIPYPSEKENRRTTFGNPLSSIFGLKFDEIAIEYFKDGENRLYEIAVACFKSKVKYKNEDEMPELNARLFKLYSAYVSEFFEGINIEAEIVNVCLPSNSKISIADYAIERMNSQKENAGREVIEEKEFIPAIIKSSETGKIDLIGKIGGKFNYSEYRYDETTTIHKSEDGRYFAGLISKKDGNRYYSEIPEEEGRKLLSETK